jgi:choline dehydrogenase-like flavoprotein
MSASGRYALEDSADFVIVGTGAGGATAARVLSEAGLSVIMLEEGPRLAPEQRALGLLDAMTQSVRDMGTLATHSGAPFPLLLGRVVGGSTAINSGIVWRMPDDVRADFVERFGLGELLAERELDRVFSQLERELEIEAVDDAVQGGNARLMRDGAEALGLTGRAIRRNAKRCEGSARCLQGCPRGARQSMDVSFVPFAERHGARLYDRARVERVNVAQGRACGVEGQLLDADDHARGRFRAIATHGVIVAAGAIYTPLLLWQSGLRGRVGEGFQAHPGAAVVGRFGERVGMGFGATQAYEVPLHAEGLKLESLSLPPELLAARLPGAGEEFQRRLRQLDYFAQWASVVRMGARGRVRPARIGRGVRVSYEPTDQDFARVKRGLTLIVRMMFAAGAEEVYPGIASLPEVFTRAEQADLIETSRVQRRDVHLMASHHFGTAAASANPALGVVGTDLQCHDLPGLYVMDSAALPTNLGVNPQHSIMALAFRGAERLANDSARGRAAA